MELEPGRPGRPDRKPAGARPRTEAGTGARKEPAKGEAGKPEAATAPESTARTPATAPAPAPEPTSAPIHATAPAPVPEPTPAGDDRSAEAEAGKGEPVCAYGVEVVELLEMEPLDGPLPWPRRRRPYHRYASAAFFVVFVLGVLNAAAVLLNSSGLSTPDELSGGSCEIAGEVRDTAGAPIPNATIVLTDSTRSTFSNSDGWYVLKGVPAGTHRVEAAARGYGTMSVRVEARPNLLRTVDFTLEKGGADVRLDASGPIDFGEPASSYMWAVPVMIALSVLALAAAILVLRRKLSRTALAMGAAGALSFGFGIGAAVAVLGVLLGALELREREGPPLKKLRVGISYPSKRRGARKGAGRPAIGGATLRERYSVGLDELEGAQAAYPEVVAEMVLEPARDPPRPAEAGGREEPRQVPERADIEEVEVYLKERSLRAKMASAEIEPSATLGRGEFDRDAAPRPRRFIRRSRKGRVLCFVCVNEIGQGHEYLRCSCGKTMHLSCLREPRCPDCGCSFRKGG